MSPQPHGVRYTESEEGRCAVPISIGLGRRKQEDSSVGVSALGVGSRSQTSWNARQELLKDVTIDLQRERRDRRQRQVGQ